MMNEVSRFNMPEKLRGLFEEEKDYASGLQDLFRYDGPFTQDIENKKNSDIFNSFILDWYNAEKA